MHSSDTPFKPARPTVIDEVFDGESVIVNLDTGTYFALSPAATSLWSLIADGRSVDSLVASTGADKGDVTALLDQLIAEQLVMPAATDAGPANGSQLADGAVTIEKFTDMQSLLLFDPIHDIELDGSGWPTAEPA